MKVFGTILDETGEPIPGANISSATYQNIVEVSDKNGKFELTSEKITDISPVKISYVGYKDQFILAKKLQGAKITMEQDIFALQEVQVTGVKKPSLAIEQPNASKSGPIQEHFKKYATPYTVAFSLLIIVGGIYAIKKAT